MTAKSTVTVITPVYNEAETLHAYYQTVSRVLIAREDCEYHVLFVDDGSVDGSWKIIEEICASSPRFQAIRLSRNFGAHAALSAGFDHATGHAVAVLACDLQDPPQVIVEFVEKWRAGAQIVWGHRRTRTEGRWETAASRLFMYLVRRFAMPRDSKFTTGSFLLADRLVIDALRQFREINRITFALVAWTGFTQETVVYDRQPRPAGVTRWTLDRRLKAMYDTFIGFSELPARLVTLLGVAMWALSIVLGVYLLVAYFGGSVLRGWTGIMFTITVFGGLLFLVLGIFGEYLHRIYLEVAHRPVYLVSARVGETLRDPAGRT